MNNKISFLPGYPETRDREIEGDPNGWHWIVFKTDIEKQEDYECCLCYKHLPYIYHSAEWDIQKYVREGLLILLNDLHGEPHFASVKYVKAATKVKEGDAVYVSSMDEAEKLRNSALEEAASLVNKFAELRKSKSCMEAAALVLNMRKGHRKINPLNGYSECKVADKTDETDKKGE